jgi:hypothetical protein
MGARADEDSVPVITLIATPAAAQTRISSRLRSESASGIPSAADLPGAQELARANFSGQRADDFAPLLKPGLNARSCS